MKTRNIRRLMQAAAAVAIVASAGALSSCDKKVKSTSTSGIAEVAVDQSFERIIKQEVEVFEYIYPQASIMTYYVDGKAAIDSIMAMGDVKTAVTARELTTQEVEYLKSKDRNVKQHRIAIDALALIVNPANTFDEPLSKAEIAKVLSGEISSWDRLGPTNVSGAIDVIFEHQNSSTVAYMRDSLMNGRPFGSDVHAQKTSKEVFDIVARNKNALGIIGVSWISSDLKHEDGGSTPTASELAKSLEKSDTTQLDFSRDVKVLKVRADDSPVGYKPYQAYIFDGSYPLYRSIFMVTTAVNGTIGHGFYSFVTGFQGQKLIQLTGVLPAIVRPRMVQVN